MYIHALPHKNGYIFLPRIRTKMTGKKRESGKKVEKSSGFSFPVAFPVSENGEKQEEYLLKRGPTHGRIKERDKL